MAFEGVSTSSLRSALNSCLNNLSYDNSRDILSSISSNNVWQSVARDNVKKALGVLVNERYKQLEDLIMRYQNVVALIDKYKALGKENTDMQNRLPGLRARLFYPEPYLVNNEVHYRTATDWNVDSEIKNIEQRIRDNEKQMRSLETQVSNSI